MRFKFCGNMDCPDWVISEVVYLTKINAVKLRIISNNIVNNIILTYNESDNNNNNSNKNNNNNNNNNTNNTNNKDSTKDNKSKTKQKPLLTNIAKSIEEMNYSEQEASIILSVLSFILKNSAKYEVDPLILSQELLQLGLPQENADSIVKVHKTNYKNLLLALNKDVFGFTKVNKVESKISYILANNYRDYNDISNKTDNDNVLSSKNKLESKVSINLKNNNSNSNTNNNNNNGLYSINKELLGKLINDLEKGLNIIKSNKN